MTVYQLDIIRITANMEHDSIEDVKNVFHVIAAGSGTATDLAFMTTMGAMIDSAYQYCAGKQTTALTYVDIDFYNISQDISMGQVDWPTRVAGSATSERMPMQVAALCHFPTTNSNSSGKKYIAGFTEEWNSAQGLLSSALQTSLASFVAEFLGATAVGTLDIYFGNYNSTLDRFLYWVAGAVDIIWSTQRRRKQGVGG